MSEPNDSLTTAQNLGSLLGTGRGNQSFDNWVGKWDSNDYFSFSISTPHEVHITLSGLRANANFYLFGGNGTSQLNASLLPGTKTDSIHQLLTAGSYYVRVSSVSQVASHYSLDLSAKPDLGGNTTAGSLGLGRLSETAKTITGWLGQGDNQDYFRFLVPNAGRVLLTLSNMDANANVQLLSQNGNVLATSTESGKVNDTLAVHLASSGTYYAKVLATSGTTDYTLSLSMAGDTDVVDPVTDLTNKWVGWLGRGDLQDVYTFFVDTTSNLTTLTLDNKDGDANLYLYNAKNQALLASSTATKMNDEEIRYQLSTGIYFAKVVTTSTALDYTLEMARVDDTGGDTVGTATELKTSASGWLGSGDSTDFYTISLATTGHLSLTLAGLTADANLYLMNANGTGVLASSILTGKNTENIDVQLTGGSYLVKISRANTTSATDYELTTSFAADTGMNAFKDFEEGSDNLNYSATGWLGTGDTQDFHRFVITTPGDYALNLRGSDNDLNLFLYQGTSLITSSQATTDSNSESIRRFLDSGTYFARAARQGLLATDYTLTLNYLNTYDFYRFELPWFTTVNLTLTLSGDSPNADLFLFDAANGLLSSSTKAGTSNDSISELLWPGVYYVRVNRGEGGFPDYTLTSEEVTLDPLSQVATGPNSPIDAGNISTWSSYSNYTATGWVGRGNTFDYYRFVTTRTSGVLLTLSKLTGSASFDLLDENQTRLLQSTATTDGKTIFTQVSAGTYYARIGNSGSASTSYSLDLYGLAYRDPGNDRDNPWGEISFFDTTTGTLNADTTTDPALGWDNDYNIVGDNNSGITNTFFLSDLTDNVNLSLLVNDNTVATSTKNGRQEEFIQYNIPSGIFNVPITNIGKSDSTYTLSRLTSYSWDNFIGHNDPHDYYTFVMDTAGHAKIQLFNMEKDANLFLISRTGATIYASRSGGNQNEIIEQQLSAGTYYARVSATSTNSTFYGITLRGGPESGGNTIDTPTLFTSSALGWVGNGDPNDCYSFNLETASVIDLSLTELTKDANISIYSNNKRAISYTNASGSTDEHFISQLSAGTYLVKVTAVGSNSTSYMLGLEQNQDTGSDTQTIASDNIGINSNAKSNTISGWLGTGDPNDFYRFTIATSSMVSLTLGSMEKDVELTLLTGNGIPSPVRSTKEGNQRIIERQLGAGTYYAKLSRIGSNQGEYTFSLQTTEDTALDTPSMDTALLTKGVTATGWVGVNDTLDFYRLVVADSGNISLTLANLNANANLFLYGTDGASIISTITSSQLPGISNDTINHHLTAGTYMVKVTGTASTSTDYKLGYNFTTETGGSAEEGGELSEENKGWVGNGDSIDYFRFTTTNNGNVVLSLTGMNQNADLFLYSSTGSSLLASSTLTGTDNDVAQALLTAGSYLAMVKRVGTAHTSYALSYDLIALDANGESVNTASPLGNLSRGELVTGTVGTSDPADYLLFGMQSTGHVSLFLSGLTADANLYLLDEAGETVMTSANGDTANEQIDRQLAPGSYYLLVNGTAATTEYNLLVDLTADIAGDTTDTARTMTVGNSTTEWLGSGDSDDFFTFVLTRSNNIVVSLFDMMDNLDLYLLDGDGNTLSASQEVDISEEILSRTLSAGIYYAHVNGSVASSTYALQIATFTDGGSTPDNGRDLGELGEILTGNGWLGDGNSIDFFRFYNRTQGMLSLLLSRLDADADLKLFSSNGTLLLVSSLQGGANNENIQLELNAGTYYAAVYSQVGNTDYLLSIDHLGEAGSTTGSAMPVGTLAPETYHVKQGAIRTNDTDLYLFYLQESGQLSVTMDGLQGLVNLSLLNSQGYSLFPTSSLTSQSVLSSGIEGGITATLQRGTYYVRLAGVGGSSDYSLQMRVDPTTAVNTVNAPLAMGLLNSIHAYWGMTSGSDNEEFYSFELASETIVGLGLTGFIGNLNLYLYEQGGTVLIDSSSDGVAPQESLELALAAGTYWVKVSSPTLNSNTSYQLTLNPTFTDPPESLGDSPLFLGNEFQSEARATDWSANITGYVGDNDPLDIYLFTLGTTQQVGITLSGLNQDADIFLLDAMNWQNDAPEIQIVDWLDQLYSDTVFSASTRGTTNETLQNTLSAGTYYVAVRQFSGNTLYQLAVTAVNSDAAADNLTITTDFTDKALGELTSNILRQDSVGDSDPLDFYSFTLDSERQFTASLTNMTADAELFLVQGVDLNATLPDLALANWLDNWKNNISASSQTLGDESLNATLAAGLYYVVVRQGSGTTNYDLNLSSSFVEGAAGGQRQSSRSQSATGSLPFVLSETVNTDSNYLYQPSIPAGVETVLQNGAPNWQGTVDQTRVDNLVTGNAPTWLAVHGGTG
ncbi:MAG: hypothetical protein G8345_09885 [Magnetococcales bacterium]|nr:PPC domain-containing protein [Magnetococcales bacterium]NGZ27180.1 hypothetical protein [Magnetococcales bacterium]